MPIVGYSRKFGSSLPTVATQIAALSPVGWWRLGESGGSFADSSVNLNTATLSGSATQGVTGALTGDSNGALTLSGGFCTFTKINLTASQSRIAWVKTTSADAASTYAASPALVVLGEHLNTVWDSFGVHGGKVRFNRYNAAGGSLTTVDSVTSVNDGAWHMIGATYNHTTGAVVIYVDGLSDGSGTVPTHAGTYGGVDRIGGSYSNGTGTGDLFDGTLDEVAVFTKVLTAQNFADLWDKSRLG